MQKKGDNKKIHQPFDTRVEFDDKVYIARNKKTIPPLSQGAESGAVKYKKINENNMSLSKLVDYTINDVMKIDRYYDSNPSEIITNEDKEKLIRAIKILQSRKLYPHFPENELYMFIQYAEMAKNIIKKYEN